jgi:hypothetical protein
VCRLSLVYSQRILASPLKFTYRSCPRRFQCEIRHLPLDCHCDSGVSQ